MKYVARRIRGDLVVVANMRADLKLEEQLKYFSMYVLVMYVCVHIMFRVHQPITKYKGSIMQFHSFNDLSLLRCRSRQKRTDTRQAHMRKSRRRVILQDAESNILSTKGKEGEGCSVTHVSAAALTRVLTTDAVVSSGARTGDTTEI